MPTEVTDVLLQEEEAKTLVRDAIASGIFNDLGSGSNIDICVITRDKIDYLRPYEEANKKGDRYECRVRTELQQIVFGACK